MFEHLRDDDGLRRRRMSAAFADVDHQRVGARELQHVGIHQIVDQHDIGLRQRAGRLERHQFDVARPRAN